MLTFGTYGQTLSSELKQKLHQIYKTKEGTLKKQKNLIFTKCNFCNIYHTASCKTKVYSIYKYLSMYFKKSKFHSKKKNKKKYNFYRSAFDNPFNRLHWRQK